MLENKTLASFASLEQARKALAARDEWAARLSPFERAARMQTARPVGEQEFLSFLAAQALPWPPEEAERVRRALAVVGPRLARFVRGLPAAILLVKTTGADECRSAYTRRNALMLPPNKLAYEQRDLERLLAHELFHILSRHQRALRERLYATIGFRRCGEVALPGPLDGLRITNPDAPCSHHCVRVSYEGAPLAVLPVVYGCGPYDAAQGGELFDYLVFRLLAIEEHAGAWRALERGGGPLLLTVEQVSGFFTQVGRNARNVTSPEEILAESFTALVMDARDVPSPEVVQAIARVLAEWCA